MDVKEFVFKIAVLGSAGVGKTSLINRYVDRMFTEDYKPTLGASIIAKDVVIEKTDIRYAVRLVLWDLAGQEKYESVRPMYFQGCVGAILVYDVTRAPSFNEIEEKWLNDFKQYALPNSSYILIGNKIDLDNIRKVETGKGQKLADSINSAAFIETSAKTGENVDECFTKLVNSVLRIVGEDV
ncbi:MAG: GTP-binding protein [Candidatus Lokiarchaeota archaeon]|nr:GTP-binding protein [Candidatus Lokiarchaeota archaeon]